MEEPQYPSSFVDIGEKLFQWRDYTAVPLLLLLLFTAEPTAPSATIGTLLIMLGELIRIYGVSFIGTVSRTRTTSLGQELVTSGPFAFVRNPLYIGNFIISSGVAIYSSVVWVIFIVMVLTGFQYYCIVKYEETLLTEKFGDAYRKYMETVPAWLPKRVPSLEEIQWPESFTPAIRSERRTFAAIALVLLALMMTGRQSSGR